ncbi:ABC transporter substrate-binding protein [Kocuria sp.]|uniref:ABC transporter substrate-binding protein n=1 Tax=Kocuria sp. TaxID=1871328 RepID=UPI0026E057C5|nr:ABC transporter substrate-binding protein [Kocuria sp.]MDO5617468.1 ABC transporter substrate-binding protein [Kocuria sp.]
MKTSTARVLVGLSTVSLLALTACTSTTGADTGSTDGTLETISDGQLTVCSESNYPPFEMEEGGEMVGLDMDLAAEIAKDNNLEVHNVTLPFETMVSGAALDTRQCDIVTSALTMTDERRSVMDFSEPYFDNQLGLVVKDGSQITSVQDAVDSKARVGVMQQTTGDVKAKELGLNAVQFEDVLMFQDLQSGGVDAVLDDLVPIAQHSEDYPDFVVVEEVEADDQFGVAVRKGDTAMLAAVNSTLERIKGDGTLEEITQKWVPITEQ